MTCRCRRPRHRRPRWCRPRRRGHRHEGQALQSGDADALAGEPVTWVNDDGTAHDVAPSPPDSTRDGWRSARASARRIAEQGTYEYHCTLHRFMFGSVRVFGLALGAGTRSAARASRDAQRSRARGRRRRDDRAPRAAEPGRPSAARPRARPQVQRAGPTAGPSAFRARSGELLSPVVSVAARPLVHVSATRHGALISVTWPPTRHSGAPASRCSATCASASRSSPSTVRRSRAPHARRSRCARAIRAPARRHHAGRGRLRLGHQHGRRRADPPGRARHR